MALDIEVQDVGESPRMCMITLSGGCDPKSYALLDAEFKRLHKDGVKHLVLHLGGLRFMNEPEKLLRYEGAFRKVGGGIVLYEVPAKLRVVFQTLELDTKIAIRGSLADALGALKAMEPVDRRKKSRKVAVDRRVSSEMKKLSPDDIAEIAEEARAEPDPVPEPEPVAAKRAPASADTGGGGSNVLLIVLLLAALGAAGAYVALYVL